MNWMSYKKRHPFCFYNSLTSKGGKKKVKKVRKRVIGGMTLLFLLIAMACPAYAALWSDESTGVLKQTNKDAGNPADET